MKEFFSFVFIFVIFLSIVVGTAWLVGGNNFLLFSFFAPKYADAQRKVFENTAPYNEGMKEDLNRMKEEYILASKDNKAALRIQILTQFASYDTNRLTPDLRDFLNNLRNGDMGNAFQ